MVGNSRQGLMDAGRTFYKMSGSGNDFVFFDVRDAPAGKLEDPESIRTICARGTGVGADGVVFLDQGRAALREAARDQRYFRNMGLPRGAHARRRLFGRGGNDDALGVVHRFSGPVLHRLLVPSR